MITSSFVDECLASWALLSDRQREVATLRAYGKRNKEIGKALGMAVKTVDTHNIAIKDRMGCDLSELPIRVLAALGKLVVDQEAGDSAARCVAIPSSISEG